MPFWKCAVLAILAIPRYACLEGEDEPEQDDPDQAAQDDPENMLSPEQLHKIMSKIDADSNGKVSLDEVLQFSDLTQKQIAGKESKNILEEIDSDKDAKISLEELMNSFGESDPGDKEVTARKAVEEKKFKAADADGDGLLNEVELSALYYPETHEGVLQIATQYTLETKDTDKDGFLTAKEFWEGDQVAGEEIGASEEEAAEFKTLDKDGSGNLDLEELKPWESGRHHVIQSMQKLFEAADTDKDQHMTAEEVVAHTGMAGTDTHYHFAEWVEHHEQNEL
jgi:Ca2+-binding EF-hand superfamily protein